MTVLIDYTKGFFETTEGDGVGTNPATIGDVNFADVSLLLHGDGTSGSTAITDSSSNSVSITVSGNTQIDTGVKKFGTGSIEFDGTGDYLSSTDTTINSLGSVSGDPFTIEFWLYYTALATFGAGLVTKGTSGTTSAGNIIAIDLTASGYISCTLDGNYSGYEISGNTALSANTWYHVALVKDNSNVFKLFIDGTQETQTYTATGTITASSNCYIGTNQYDPGAATRTLTGYMDDIRITNGVARYTSNFTAPTAAFLDAGPTLDLSTGSVFTHTPSANVAYAFTNPPASGTSSSFTLKVTPSATITVTWPSSVIWSGGIAPTTPANGETDVYTFYTDDGGTTYYGFQVGDALA